MATNYETIYRDSKQALGEPTRAFVQFFEKYEIAAARILDIGCGQGRDALFIARLGHEVVGVDLSESGIRDLRQDAKMEKLSVEAIVADIREFTPSGVFDVIVIDRTLHMLTKLEREHVLRQLLEHTHAESFVLIADERKNLGGFQAVFDVSPVNWISVRTDKGFMFMKRVADD